MQLIGAMRSAYCSHAGAFYWQVLLSAFMSICWHWQCASSALLEEEEDFYLTQTAYT